MEELLDNDQLSSQDYYKQGKGRIAGDIFLGFFGGLVLLLVLWTIGLKLQFFGAGFLLILPYILSIVFSFSKGRRYIGIGLILLLVIPILIFGSCLFGGWRI